MCRLGTSSYVHLYMFLRRCHTVRLFVDCVLPVLEVCFVWVRDDDCRVK